MTSDPLLMQDENSGRDGRRYNEWFASRPDARLRAREAAEEIAQQSQGGNVNLPELPELSYLGEGNESSYGYTANDMRRFAEEAVRMERERSEIDAMRYRKIRDVQSGFEVTLGGAMYWNQGLDAMADAALAPTTLAPHP